MVYTRMAMLPILLGLTLFLVQPSPSSSEYLILPLLRHTPSTATSTLLSPSLSRFPRLPINSGAPYGSGQYFVSLLLGSPPQHLLLAADTASDLVWSRCSPSRHRSRHVSHSRPFFPYLSSSFSPHHCFSSQCRLTPKPSHTPKCRHTRLHSPCFYQYSYADGSYTEGIFSSETTTFNTTLNRFLRHEGLSFGCGFNNSIPTLNGAQGVLGLGRGPTSFVSQMGLKFGNKFSYCLMDYTLDPPPTSFLLIGGANQYISEANQGKKKNKTTMRYTPIQTNPLSPTFYYVGIQGVSIERVKLPILPSVWALDEFGNGGTVVDSGTTLTFLPSVAYDMILKAFMLHVSLPILDEPTAGFDLCLNVSGKAKPRLPKMSFRFVGGAVFSPPPRNYFIDTEDGVECLALQPVGTPEGFAVIGNLMQQGYLFEFDKDRSQLGFTQQGCGSP